MKKVLSLAIGLFLLWVEPTLAETSYIVYNDGGESKSTDNQYYTTSYTLPIRQVGTQKCGFPASVLDKKDGSSYSSNTVKLNSSTCKIQWTDVDGYLQSAPIFLSGTAQVFCPDGQQPQSWSDRSCSDIPEEPQQCGINETEDPVTGECVCEDGFPEDPETGQCTAEEPEPEEPTCDSNDTCLAIAESECSSQGQSIRDYSYFGGGQYGFSCGYMEQSCPDGQSWSPQSQVCVSDSDGDGTPDPYDPEPENPDNSGDTDGDGVPDDEDEFPNDPTRFQGGGSNGSTTTPPTTPIGENQNFDDTAIVSALNNLVENSNSTNENLEEIKGIGQAANDIAQTQSDQLSQISEKLSGLSNQGIEDKLDGIAGQLEEKDGGEVNSEVGDLVNKSASELGLREITDQDSQFLADTFSPLATSGCSNLVLPAYRGSQAVDVCSLSVKIVPFLEWILWGLTLIFVYNELHSVLRRRD